MNERGFGRWLPDRPATWTDVVVVGAAVLLIGTNLANADTIAWEWLCFGVVATALAFGPAASTAIGARIGAWFRAIGIAGRAALIVGYAILVGVLVSTVAIPSSALVGFFIGVMVFAVLYGVAHVVHSGEIRGWRPQRDT